MGQLNQADLRAALDLVGECEGALDLSAFRRAVLGIGRLVPGEGLAYNEIDLAKGTALTLVSPTVGDERTIAEFGRVAHQNPLVARTGSGNAGPPLAISDLLSARSFRALELYDVVFRPNGLEDQIAIHLRTQHSQIVVGVVVNRGRRGFSGRDRALLELVGPHLSRAYAHAFERERALALFDLAERGLSEKGTATVRIGPGGEVERVDERAKLLLRRYFGTEHRSGELPKSLRDWALEDGSALAPLSVEDGQGRRLTARRLGSPDEQSWCLVLLDEWSQGPAPEDLRVLGLTRREAEVLAWVARGKVDAEIGALLSISPRTVDKHLENAFRKLGVGNRTAAVARALSRG